MLQKERLVSLDVFRGMAIAGMILVNNFGNWDEVYRPLMHADWNGCTLADLVFPFFLLVVGVAIVLSFDNRTVHDASHMKRFFHVCRRTAVLFALGVLLNDFPYFDNWSAVRIPGVLQRIALCYFFAAVIYMNTRIRFQILITGFLLAIYWFLMKCIPVPGYGPGVIAKQGNLASYLDHLLLPRHLLHPAWDPEGLLSTIPAIATTLCGVLAGQWMKSSHSGEQKTVGLLISGTVAAIIGTVMGIWLPVNKSLWTSSYAVFTAGLALIVFGTWYWFVDVKGHRRIAKPLIIFGMNAITVYLASSMLTILLNTYTVIRPDGAPETLKAFIYEDFFASWAGPMKGSLLFALAYMLIWLGPMAALYRKGIHIKI